MSEQSVAGASRTARRTGLLDKIKSATCLNSPSPDSGKGKSKSSCRRMSHGFHLVEGKSGHDMEDYHVAEYRRNKDHELGLFAIFDGHLGDSVACYLRDNLFDNILEEPNFWRDPETAIKNAYRSTDNSILQNSVQLGPGGSTAVTAIVIDGKDLWVANVGDSRAVVCERGCANQLTVDHDPHMDMERKRIEKHGGFVTKLPGDVPRVNGQLAVARAFGDQSLKAHLSSEPHIRHVPIDSTIDLVILASDGLWKRIVLMVKPEVDSRCITALLTSLWSLNMHTVVPGWNIHVQYCSTLYKSRTRIFGQVMKNQEAIDLVKKVKDPRAAAKRLTTEALARKSKDDISCIVIRFG